MSGIDRLKQTVGRMLLGWSVLSIIIGIDFIFQFPNTILGGIGLQAIIWGGIDLIIGASIIYKQKEQSVTKIADTVSKSIRIDIIFIIVGFIIAVVYLQDPYFLGNGIGVIIQGFFLLVLDRTYYDALLKLKNQTKDVTE